ncbi:MAG: hypothetical protein BGO45_03630 [Microbacterium sp. 71-36]|uniref:arsenate reductase/protein-tyrosine-phosphatase family protein n=1 Tax=unclassified Microbacterium TaxID=2609290 RepID=UPI00086EFEFE|nr:MULTISPECIES: low molecular weight phosphatase family protein [unclassified Microbacterium]MBN9213019.1 low molecular weight phosphatase family protein [Microbacterium sp.]ODT36140.1 MAG: hypothetical protein ABS60_16590 [Microbacterium sp. SCN 71-17]OJV74948.1 MAG: hypothetical protein BGO45_03630 [Microbacterium sp. 71-36]
MTFSVLTVCTGNICRSPLAELILAASLSDIPDVRVESAGTGALVGHGMPDPALRLARDDGLAGESHRARQISEKLVSDAGLILALSREHRRAIVSLVPSAVRRTFTLRELANIVPAAQSSDSYNVPESVSGPAEGLRDAVALAARLRGTVPPPEDPAEFDVIDPFRRSEATYQLSYEQLKPAAVAVGLYLRRSAEAAS